MQCMLSTNVTVMQQPINVLRNTHLISLMGYGLIMYIASIGITTWTLYNNINSDVINDVHKRIQRYHSNTIGGTSMNTLDLVMAAIT